ncbi:MAG TPA: MFS transporter [Candidatus Cybelea sp.]|nr:MFS transporter [Candidatus Cybelea sp.]
MKTVEPDSGRSLLRHPPFARFWFSRIASTIAFQMLNVAVGWQVYALTGDALALGMLGLVQFVPMVALTLLVGHVADRYDRRRIIALCQITMSSAAAVLALGTAQGWLGIASIYALMAVVGGARAFENPTLQALLPNLVARPLVPRASAVSASANQTAQILGPAIGGLAYGLGPALVYGSVAVLAVLASGLVSSISMPAAARKIEAPTFESLFSGLRFVFHHRVILGTLSLDLFAVLLGGATALLPIYARDILGTGPWGLGLLRAAPPVGALTMSMVLAKWPLKQAVGTKLFVALTGFGIGTIVFGLSTYLALSLSALALLGACDVISVVIRLSLVQLKTPDDMRGRVSAVNALFIGTSNQLGEFESGVAAALFGAVASVLIGGVGTVLIALLWMWLFPELRRLRSLDDETSGA